EVASQPFDDLVDAARLTLAPLAPQRRVGGEEDSFGKLDMISLPIARQRRHEESLLPQRRPVALCVFEQAVGDRQPHGALPTLEHIVEDDPSNLPTFARAGAVTEEPAAA